MMKIVSMKSSSRKQSKKMFVIAAVVVLLVLIIYPLNFNDKTYTVKVTEKERIVDNSSENGTSSRYLIWCEDEKEQYVFENTDSLIRGKFNSSDYYGKLKVGKTYKITVIGLRIPFFSAYQNIIKVKECTERN